jgi:replication factor C subunit 1
VEAESDEDDFQECRVQPSRSSKFVEKTVTKSRKGPSKVQEKAEEKTKTVKKRNSRSPSKKKDEESEREETASGDSEWYSKVSKGPALAKKRPETQPPRTQTKKKSSKVEESSPKCKTASKRKPVVVDLREDFSDEVADVGVTSEPLKGKKRKRSSSGSAPDPPVKRQRKSSPKKAKEAEAVAIVPEVQEDETYDPNHPNLKPFVGGFRSYAGRPEQAPPNAGCKEAPTGAPSCLKGRHFVITGVLDSLTRDEAQELVESYGGYNFSGWLILLTSREEPFLPMF